MTNKEFIRQLHREEQKERYIERLLAWTGCWLVSTMVMVIAWQGWESVCGIVVWTAFCLWQVLEVYYENTNNKTDRV